MRQLVYNKVPNAVCDWVDSICADWRFERIIPAHFSAPIKAGPQQFQAAFTFAYEQAGRQPGGAAASSSNSTGGGDGDGTAAGGPLGGVLSGFGALFGRGGPVSSSRTVASAKDLPERDLKALKNIDKLLRATGAVYEDAEKRG